VVIARGERARQCGDKPVSQAQIGEDEQRRKLRDQNEDSEPRRS
jgi:hypothetical protein